MKIIATCLGDKKQVNWKGKLITTGIFKYPTQPFIFLDKEHVKKDTICDRKHHGGIDQAVYGYSEKHYAHFKTLYPQLNWDYGMFGENLTIDDLDETLLHVGDTFSVGDTILEVTKPRLPCMTLGVRFNDMRIVKQFWNTTMSGVYFKVLQTGLVSVGDVFTTLKRCPENKTIAQLYEGEKQRKQTS